MKAEIHVYALLNLNISCKLVAKLQNQCEVSVEGVTLFISGIWRGK